MAKKLWYIERSKGAFPQTAILPRSSPEMQKIPLRIASYLFSAAVLLSPAALTAQDRAPLLQDIQVKKETYGPAVSATPLVQKTGSSVPVALPSNGIRTLFPALAEVDIPGYSGVLVEALDGGVVVESNASMAFNPASNVKVATAYAVLKTFGPEFRFITNIYTDGAIDRTTGTLQGNLYVSGKDPMFGYQHAVTLASELNRMGVRTVSGDLIVTDNFVMNYSGSPHISSQTLYSTMDASSRTAAATTASRLTR
jgi:D-alanyl-D-alanine carboxypeptidase